MKVIAIGFAILSIAAVFGTYARTGLVCLAALAGLQILRTRHKFLFVLVLIISAAGSLNYMPNAWLNRMDTIRNPATDSSASVRLAVWSWTYDFAKENPLGGGFEAYRINRIAISQPADPNTGEYPGVKYQQGRAFHSMYFEVLGEHGYPGLLVFLSLFFISLWRLFSVYKSTRNSPELEWLSQYSLCLLQMMVILMVGGAFIGIAFQPVTLFSISMATMLTNCHRLQVGSTEPMTGKRPAHHAV